MPGGGGRGWLMGSAQRPREPTQQAWWESSPPCQSLTYNVGLSRICCTCGVFGRRHLQGGGGVEACGPQPL